MEAKIDEISIKEKIGYSFGDTASNLFFQTFIIFLPIFYTDVFGISAAAISTMFLVTRIWDAVNDPIMGVIADRTSTKWGKFRPYLLWLAVPYGVIGAIMFYTPDFAESSKILYAYITYTLMMMVYTAINVPYSSLMGVISPDSNERTVLSSFRFVAAFVGQFLVVTFTLELVDYFGAGDTNTGWFITMGVFGLLSTILFILSFGTTKERVPPPKGQKNNFKLDVKDLFTNLPWLLIAGATIFQLTALVARGGAISYYFKYYIQSQSFEVLGISFDLNSDEFTASFLMVGSAFTVLGAILSKWFSKILGKKNAYSWFLGISGLTFIIFFYIKPEDILLLYISQVIGSFLLGPVAVLQWALYTDTADYSEWKNNRRSTGLLMAASLFALKLGVSFGGAIIGWVLNEYGFVPNETQSATSIEGIKLLMSYLPTAAAVAGAILMIFYPLNNANMVEMENDLKQRRSAVDHEN